MNLLIVAYQNNPNMEIILRSMYLNANNYYFYKSFNTKINYIYISIVGAEIPT